MPNPIEQMGQSKYGGFATQAAKEFGKLPGSMGRAVTGLPSHIAAALEALGSLAPEEKAALAKREREHALSQMRPAQTSSRATLGSAGLVQPVAGASPKTMRPYRPYGGGPKPTNEDWLAMWEERNRMLQQQRRNEARRKFEERPMRGRARPMLPSGASAPARHPFPGALPRPGLEQRFEKGDLGRPIAPQEANLPGESVYDWEEQVRRAEEALRAAQWVAGQ